MTTFSHSLFDTVIPGLTDPFFAPATPPAATMRKAPARTAPQAPASLWRHALDEHAARRHGLATRSVFGVMAALSIGSVVYALSQTCVLMSGSSLLDAVAAFAR